MPYWMVGLFFLGNLLIGCGGKTSGGIGAPVQVSEQLATNNAETSGATRTIIVTTNRPESHEHFWVEREDHPDDWELPPLQLIDTGRKFSLELQVGWRYELSLLPFSGTVPNFIPATSEIVDLTGEPVDQVEVELLYQYSGEVDQKKELSLP